MNICDLRTEYKYCPLGMDEKAPRFSWKLEDTESAQKDYQIVVTDENDNEVWDSGVVKCSCSAQIVYAGEPLKPFTAYIWHVCVNNEAGEHSCGAGMFETGFMGQDWTAKWIHSFDFINLHVFRFCRDFEVTKKVAKARLYTTALGIYEAYINGKSVTSDVFMPGWTDYYNRVQYQAYDVTKLIKQGGNRLADQLGEGWYCSTIARNWSPQEKNYGYIPQLLQELHITYEDGTKEIIASGDTFKKAGSTYNFRRSDIYLGEIYDAVEEIGNWMEYGGVAWGPAAATDFGSLHLKDLKVEWNSGAPITRIMSLEPVSIKYRKRTGTYLVDFGQNITGRERIHLKNTKAGGAIVIRHGEMLNKDGSLYTSNLRGADAVTIYYTATKRKVDYEPSFTFYGFRYLEIAGWAGELTRENIEAIVIHSDLEDTGTFQCSNPLVNKLFDNIVWGQRGNFLDVPTDCPQRDERYGWTGDTQVFANVATYNMASAEFYTKWIRDLNLCQSAAGAYPHISPNPYGGGSWLGGAVTGWGDAGIVCPDVMLKKYGDVRIFETYLDNMVKWLEHQYETNGNSYVGNHAGYGDWLNIDDPTDGAYLSTAYLAGMAALLAADARLIGKKDIAKKMDKFAAEAKKAFQKKFVVKNQITETSQTAYLLALHFDLLPEAAYKNACDALVKSIKVKHKTHLSTGFLGTPLLLKVLTKIGQLDLAYAVLEQTTYPGWLYPVTQGATTMWERWNSWNEETGFGDIGMNSFNHYAYGAVGEWF